MNPIKRILVPIDFGDASRRALELAMLMAGAFEADVTVVHTVFVAPLMYVDGGVPFPTDDIVGAARGALDNTLEKATALIQEPRAGGKRSKVEGRLMQGEPLESILQAAKDASADLIVMGTHGRTGFARIFMGSVAEKVVRLSPIPVMTVGASGEAAPEVTAPG